MHSFVFQYQSMLELKMIGTRLTAGHPNYFHGALIRILLATSGYHTRTEIDSKHKWPLIKRLNVVFLFISLQTDLLYVWNAFSVCNIFRCMCVPWSFRVRYSIAIIAWKQPTNVCIYVCIQWQIAVQVSIVCKFANKRIKHFYRLNFPLTNSSPHIWVYALCKYLDLYFFFSIHMQRWQLIQQQKCIVLHFWGKWIEYSYWPNS